MNPDGNQEQAEKGNREFAFCMKRVALFDNGNELAWTKNSTENYLLNVSRSPMIKYSIDGATRVEMILDHSKNQIQLVFERVVFDWMIEKVNGFQIKLSINNAMQCKDMMKILGFTKYLQNTDTWFFFNSQDRDWHQESLNTYSRFPPARRPPLPTSQNESANSQYMLIL